MAAAVNDRDGTGYKSRIIDKEYRLAGKTGTAQMGAGKKEPPSGLGTGRADRQRIKRDGAGEAPAHAL